MTDDEFFDRFTRAGRAYIEAASVVVVIFGVIVLAITLVVLVVVDPGEVDMMFMIAKLEIDGGEIKLSVVDSENTLEGARHQGDGSRVEESRAGSSRGSGSEVDLMSDDFRTILVKVPERCVSEQDIDVIAKRLSSDVLVSLMKCGRGTSFDVSSEIYAGSSMRVLTVKEKIHGA